MAEMFGKMAGLKSNGPGPAQPQNQPQPQPQQMNVQQVNTNGRAPPQKPQVQPQNQVHNEYIDYSGNGD